MSNLNLTAEEKAFHDRNTEIIHFLFGISHQDITGRSRRRKIFFCRLILTEEIKHFGLYKIMHLLEKKREYVLHYLKEIENCKKYSAEYRKMSETFKYQKDATR